MINVFDVSNYKKCREKQYKSYFCLPEVGSYIINKIEKTDAWIKLGKRSYISKDNMDKLKVNNKNVYDFITKNGKCVENGYFVISGVVNELKLISFNELASQFSYSDDTPITKESIVELMGKYRFFDWVAITNKRVLNGMAYHIENQYSEKIRVNNNIYYVNMPGIDHGKGDFLVCNIDNNGQPLGNTLRLYNGIEFKEKFDNRGWQNVLSARDVQIDMPDSIVRHLTNGNSLNRVNDFKGEQLMQVIEQILAWCKKTIHPDIKWEYKKKSERMFSVASTVVENYRKLNKCTHIVTTIEVGSKDVEFKQYNISGNNKKKALEFNVPIDKYTADKLVEDRCIYFGILGYVRGDAPSLFKVKGQISKDEYDGLERYTVSSSGMNRICRGLEEEEIKSGERRADVIRSILQVDRALEKSSIGADLILFRGMPLSDAYKFGNCDASTLESARIPNTAFTSTSLNLQSTLMFGLPRNEKEGLVQIIENNIGINAMYINNIAGWEEQYEVLVDRCYDIINDKFMMELKTDGGVIKVVRSHFVMHRPLGNINLALLENKGIYNFDEFGRVGFYKELFDNEMHEVFDRIREKGMTNAQYIEKTRLIGIVGTNNSASSYIVADAGDLDILYRLDRGVMGGNIITIYEVNGDKKALRNYWSDRNRHGGKKDYNYKWSTYNHDQLNIGDINLYSANYISISDECTIEEITETIYKDIVYRDNVVAFPLLDIARYFGQVFQQFVVQEGYIVKQSFRIDRVGKEDDPQDGYVPVKFRIDGDNDDDLLLQIVFKRNKNGELSISYKGQAASKKVNETKSYNYNTFNTDVANKVAEQILYTFAKKLDLSCVSKVDRFIEQYCIRNGFNNIRVQQNAEKDKSGSYFKKYRIIRVPEAYNILGVKILGGEFKLLISNKIAKEMIMFNHQSSMREINRMFNITLNKLKDESSFNDLMHMEFNTDKSINDESSNNSSSEEAISNG